MKWDWGEYSNTVFVFDEETEELIIKFDNDKPPFYVSEGGVFGMTLKGYEFEGYPHGRKVTVVRPFRFNDDYYSKFEPGHKAPRIVMKCWRMLQLNRLNQ